ncbi:urease accessory protein UreG [Oculatella sp. FACHB-28]|uniref:urease accessory protein UreG n=1 Tax=Cyanophyceae TaxID=3028117 RepID=UPI001688973A|nr:MULTISPECIES: urease accessory protein UreG [Cyanophyceae]MBD1871652.1 urease accessory protein UreG [Cyanobacteria bacterium FACHB-471]MBD2057657.1 urease accessory protein UreG [Oculatella sp. FACHB-28]MBD2070367.1 urease accessory protein UreG [Leptolyngbya sp. FACHB-671]
MQKSVARLGVGGPVGSGKTALLERLVPLLMQQGIEVAVVTNDLLTQEDADRLKRKGFLPSDRIIGVETGSCPHTAIREDPTMNLLAIRNLERSFPELDLVFVESGGDNLASTFSYDLIDAYIFVLDVGAGDDIPRKNGPGFMQADLVVINKIDIAPYVGADLALIQREASERRRGKPIAYTNCKTGEGLDQVVQFIFNQLLFQPVRVMA